MLKDGLYEATGNPALTAYSMRHTGKHLVRSKALAGYRHSRGCLAGLLVMAFKMISGAAGIYSDAMLSEFRALTDRLIDDLPEQPNSPTSADTSNYCSV